MKVRSLLQSRLGVAAAAATATLVVAGGIAVASGMIPGSDGVIHGCYDKQNGNLRVIDPSSDQCRNSELGIQWNSQGPAGAQGPQGPAGSARAYAHVLPNGALDTPKTLNVASTRHPATGFYCLTLSPNAGVTAEQAVAVVTVDWDNELGVSMFSYYGARGGAPYLGGTPYCTTGEVAIVTGLIDKTAGDANLGTKFTPADVAFVVVVP